MGTRTAAESYEAKLDRIREKVWSLQDSATEAGGLGVVHTFSDAVIVQDYASGRLMEMSYAEVDGDILFGEPKEVDNLYVTKRLLDMNPKMAMKDISNLVGKFEEWAGGSYNGCISGIKGSPGIDDPDALCTWLHYQALGKWPAEKTEETIEDDAELTGPIVMKNAAKRIAYAAVLVPGEIDYDGEAVTAEKTEASAHEWMELYQNVDLQHSLNNVGVPVESYLTPEEMTVKALDGEAMILPKGTWILGSRLDEQTWGAVEKGTLTGYSIMGMKRAAMKAFQETVAAGKSTDGPTVTAALKKTLLRDLGEDWVPVYVSVVASPAVPKAKFFALKAQEADEDDPTILDRMKAALGKLSTKSPEAAEKEGRRFAKATVEKIKTAANALMELVKEAEAEQQDKTKSAVIPGQKGGDCEMTEEEIKDMIATAVKEAFGPLETKLTEIETSIKERTDETEEELTDAGDQKEEETQETETENQEPEVNDQLETFKSEVNGKLQALANKLGGTRATALKGQDGDDGDETNEPALKGRDIYGRKRRSS